MTGHEGIPIRDELDLVLVVVRREEEGAGVDICTVEVVITGKRLSKAEKAQLAGL